MKQGRVWKYSDNIDTDVIIPARYLNTASHEELARHCMEDIDISFAKEVKDSDIIVAGENFGCGSSREHAPIAIKASGVSLVIAKSFARIFYRNAINIGLAILEHPYLSDETAKDDIIEYNLSTGVVKNITTGKEYTCNKFPKEIQNLINEGGLINYTRKKLIKIKSPN
ncbi:TPA: 3-isopropylmalate dehydratase small subunit [Candidatus Avigastranaerophilus faecigallinarum]|nr:3-isopropylmalate dehydratase small subunit [Candidatus Avigastranaerophilus faecigallinarum]